MRHSEILQARFDQIDFDKLRLYIPEAKAGGREQPITSELAEVLQREREHRVDPNGWIFPSARPRLGRFGHRTRMDRPLAAPSSELGSIRPSSRPTLCGTRRSQIWSCQEQIRRPFSASAATRL